MVTHLPTSKHSLLWSCKWSYLPSLEKESSLVSRKRYIPGLRWSSQERSVSEAQRSLNNNTDLKAGFLYWFPHSRVGDMQTGYLDAICGELPKTNTNLVGPQCTFLYSALCLASVAKCWTRQKKGTKTTLLGLMGFQQSAYLVMAAFHISNGHRRKQQISMEEQTSYTLEPASGVWEAGPVFFLSLIPFTAPSSISTLSDERTSQVRLLGRVKHDLFYWRLGDARK